MLMPSLLKDYKLNFSDFAIFHQKNISIVNSVFDGCLIHLSNQGLNFF